jgi:hypothetical protein
MKLEDFEKLTDEELRQRAVNVFEDAPNVDLLVSTILLPKARFYLDEIERRRDHRISRRDFEMELVVIFLIGLELVTAVGLAVWGEHDQARQVQRQLDAIGHVQGALSNLDKNSKATADTLASVNDTMKTMELSLQKQVELFYDVQINVVYSESTKKLVIINSGRSNISVWSQRIGEDSDTVLNYPKPDIIPPTGSYEISLEDAVNKISGSLPKGEIHQYSFTLQVKNEKQERFTVNGVLIARWHGDTVTFNIPSITLVPGWDKK